MTSPTPFEARLQKTASAVDNVLNRFLGTTATAAPELAQAMRHGVMGGGKRLRPFLLLETACLFGPLPDAAIKVAASLECVHCYSLIHDDLPAMDDDALRRGQPTVHIAFSEATAILAGDALLTLAFEILGDPATVLDAETRGELIVMLARAAGGDGMVAGQMLDLDAEHKPLTLDDIIALQKLKTGALIEYACVAGAVLGNAGTDDRAALKAYAGDIGLAFQIADDLLDAEADAAQIGKQTAKDGDAGKATFIGLLGIEGARARAHELVDGAIARLDRFGAPADGLRDAARFVIDRKT